MIGYSNPAGADIQLDTQKIEYHSLINVYIKNINYIKCYRGIN
jgi:hypothetical protein